MYPGIPDPEWGGLGNPIDLATPDEPADWTAEVAGYYYVAGGSGSDAFTHGTPSSPRATVPSTLPAGSFVRLSGTFSSWPQRIQIDGTEADPVWIVSDPASPATITNGREVVFSGRYLFVDGLRFREDATLALRQKDGYYFSDHACLRNLDMVGSGTALGSRTAISLEGASSTQRLSQVVVHNCEISYYGDHNTTTPNDFHAVKNRRNTDYIWCLDTTTHHLGGDGMQVGDALAEADRPTHTYIGGCTSYYNLENAFDVKASFDTVISTNTAYGFVGLADSSGEGIVSHEDCARLWVINNHIHDSEIGIIATEGTDYYVIGNLIRSCNLGSYSPGSLFSPNVGVHVRNVAGDVVVAFNTIDDSDYGVQLPAASPDTVVHGNIFSNRGEAAGYDVFINGGSNVSVSDNLYDSKNVSLGGAAETRSVEGDPDYEDYTTGNLHLGPASDAINAAGDLDAVFSLFETTYGLGIDVDIDRIARPDGSKDIGAYQR